MSRTATEIQADLDIVNSAIQNLISGKRLTQLRIGSGDFARLYQYSEISYDVLKGLKDELTQELATITIESDGIKFRKQSHVPLTVKKFIDR